MVVGWVKWYRKGQADMRHGYRGDDTQQAAVIAHAKSDMRNAVRHVDRWNILCNCTNDVEICMALDRWAEQTWGEAYIRDRNALKKWMAAELSAAIGKAVANVDATERHTATAH